MGMEAHVVFGCFGGIDVRRRMSNSLTSGVALWAAVSRYFGEVIAMSLNGGVEDGASPVITQTEGVGSFRRSTGRQFERSS